MNGERNNEGRTVLSVEDTAARHRAGNLAAFFGACEHSLDPSARRHPDRHGVERQPSLRVHHREEALHTEFPNRGWTGWCAAGTVGDLIKKEGRTFLYRYDFGDGWEHELTLEDSHFVEPVMLCFEGERACPPGGCGRSARVFRILQGCEGPRP